MQKELSCKIALFSLDENNPRIVSHCAKGGLAAIYENGFITIAKGSWKIRVEKVGNIPMTFGGRAEFNIANALAATLALYTKGFKTEDIRLGLQTFTPSPAQTPGRMNIFRFQRFTVMLDYAHNTHGFKAIGKFVQSIDSPCKVGIIAAVGDRRDEDIVNLGIESGKIFDEIIIRQDKNMRGREPEELIDLLSKGIKQVDPNKPIVTIPKESEAIDFAIKNAKENSFIMIVSDVIPDALEQVKHYKEVEDSKLITA